jgi:hypothetical protein
MISGYTSQKLDLVKTYSNTNPYQIGINGVTNVTYNPTNLTAVTSVSYSIGNIDYVTELSANNGLTSQNSKGRISSTSITRFYTNSSGYDFEPYINFPNKQNTFNIKEESKMGLVFPPKVNNELFIERQDLAVFERFSRISEITNLENLVTYKNGYYNIKQII